MSDHFIAREGDYELLFQSDGNLVRHHVPSGQRVGLESIWPLAPSTPGPIPPIPPLPGPVPPTPRGVGVSHYDSFGDPTCHLHDLAWAFYDVGAQHTRIAWTMSPWSNGRNQPEVFWNGELRRGITFPGFQPWVRLSDGRFDLENFDPQYWGRLEALLQAFHGRGIHVVLTLLDKYLWTEEKGTLPGVPDRNLQPPRHNINGVRWGDPNDNIGGYKLLPDWVLDGFLGQMVQVIAGRPGVSLEAGNEMSEKEMQVRMRDRLRELGWVGPVQASRNEDTPGQWANMVARAGFDRLSIHGKDTLDYLDEDYQAPHAPGSDTWQYYEDHPQHKTFRATYASGEIVPDTFTLSTDGCGFNEPPFYHKAALTEVVADGKRRGFSIEHQARELKLGRFNEGRYNLADFDAAFARQLVEA